LLVPDVSPSADSITTRVSEAPEKQAITALMTNRQQLHLLWFITQPGGRNYWEAIFQPRRSINN
jgi:hypothetical protein